MIVNDTPGFVLFLLKFWNWISDYYYVDSVSQCVTARDSEHSLKCQVKNGILSICPFLFTSVKFPLQVAMAVTFYWVWEGIRKVLKNEELHNNAFWLHLSSKTILQYLSILSVHLETVAGGSGRSIWMWYFLCMKVLDNKPWLRT